jgi:hypothetical protein
MVVHLIRSYLIALVGLAVGAALGLVATAIARRRATPTLSGWDARLTVPLLLAAAAAHLALIPAVELQRQVMFGLYIAALTGTVVMAIAGRRIWRLGAIVLPVGSIVAYTYYAVVGHAADGAGIAVKIVELLAILAAIKPLLIHSESGSDQRVVT